MAKVPDGALMQRAAAGLAAFARACSDRSTARASWCWPAAATTAATRCTPARGWRGAGRRRRRDRGRGPAARRPRRQTCVARGGRIVARGRPCRARQAAGAVPTAATGRSRPQLRSDRRRRPDHRRPDRDRRPRRPARARRVAGRANRAGARDDGAVVVAVDLPSGIDADTGEVPRRRGAGRRDSHVRHHQARPADRSRRELAGPAELIDIGLGRTCPSQPSRRSRRPTSPRCCRSHRRSPTSTGAACSAW